MTKQSLVKLKRHPFLYIKTESLKSWSLHLLKKTGTIKHPKYFSLGGRSFNLFWVFPSWSHLLRCPKTFSYRLAFPNFYIICLYICICNRLRKPIIVSFSLPSYACLHLLHPLLHFHLS